MVLVVAFAQRILDENNYTVADFGALTNVEYLIDNAIDYVNSEAGTSIVDLAGVADAKTITATEQELVAVRTCTVLLLRAFVDRGPNASVQGLAVTTVIADPQFRVFSKMLKRTLNRLRGRSMERV